MYMVVQLAIFGLSGSSPGFKVLLVSPHLPHQVAVFAHFLDPPESNLGITLLRTDHLLCFSRLLHLNNAVLFSFLCTVFPV